MSRFVDPNADVQVITGDPSDDDGTWEVDVDGRRVRVRVVEREVVDVSFVDAFTGDPDNGTIIIWTAEAAVSDALEACNAR